MIGQRLLHYEIVEKLGEGGMGVVYKARDTHLDRFVAIKVLPPEKVADQNRKARFVQEAKSASALHHPGIVHIYDISSDGGQDFIAMEYVAGKTLDQIIGRKGLPVNETLKYVIQIADALARAHSAGIVHRDLKPSNVMVDEHGLVKVLDFGLAKLTEILPADENAPTATLRATTEEGTIVGTAAYMSPEQAEGKKVDARSDIFSFGAVLYEMVSGRRAFQGEGKLSTLSAVLHQDPKPIENIPHDLDKIITRCLRKDPERRAPHIEDVRLALLELKEESESGRLLQPATGTPRKRKRASLLVAAGAILSLAAAAGLSFWLYKPERLPTLGPLMRVTSDSSLTTDPSLSPDGRLIAYASDRATGENLDIWLQQADGRGTPLRLTSEPADEYEPSFAPDGSQIAFRSEREGGGIYTVPVLGGDPRLIARKGRQPRFSPDGTHIAYVTGAGGFGGIARGELFVIPSQGGTPQALAPAPLGAVSPVWSPDGKFILFAAGFYRPDNWGVVSSGANPPTPPIVVPLAEVKKKEGLADIVPWKWLAGNRILFSAKSGDTSHLFEIGLSPPGLMSKTWKLAGTLRRLTAGTEQAEKPALAGEGSAAGAHRLAFAGVTRNEDLWSLAVDANHPGAGGKLQRLTQGGGFHIFPAVSRDGTKLAYISHAAYNDEVWLLDLKTGKKLLLSNQVSVKFKPVIHADGMRVIYESVEPGARGVYSIPTSGGTPERACEKCGWPWDWSGDHRHILGIHFDGGSVSGDIIDVGTGKSSTFLKRPGMELYQFRWSPDGRWVVFLSQQSTSARVYVIPFTGGQGPDESAWIPITDGSTWEDKLSWSPDGNWIYALSDRDGFLCLWAYPLDPRTRKPAGKPVPVFHSHTARLSVRNANLVSLELSVARDKIVFNQGEVAGNIWMAELR